VRIRSTACVSLQIITVALLVIGLGVTKAAAQLSLLLNPSVRSIGMAGTGGADNSDPRNSYNNPAVILNSNGVYVTGFYDEIVHAFSDDFSFKGLDAGGGYYFTLGSNVELGVGAQFRYAEFSFGTSIITNSQGEQVGTFEPNDGYVGVTVAVDARFKNSVSFAIGGTIKSWKADFAPLGFGVDEDASADGTAYDIGARVGFITTAETGWRTVASLGVSTLNEGESVDFGGRGTVELPRAINTGFSIRTSSPPVRMGTDALVSKFGLVFNFDAWIPTTTGSEADGVFSLGVEFSTMQVGFLRLGWIIPEDSETSTIVLGAGLGLPTRYFTARVDLAVVPLEVLGSDVDIDDRDQKLSLFVDMPLPLGSEGVD